MRRWIELAAQLYPAKWRQRYGGEFEALLSDVNPGWRELLNVLGGALKMQVLKGEGIYLKLGTGFALLGIVAALAASLAVPKQYISSAVFRVESAREQPLLLAIQDVTSRTSLSQIISKKDLDLYHLERLQIPLEDVIAGMNHDLTIQLVRIKDSGMAVSIDFRYRDPRAAQAVVNTIIAKLNGSSNFLVVQPASFPTVSVSPSLAAFVSVGFATGIILGLFIALSLRQPRRTLLVTGMGLAGCLLGAGLSLLVPNRYISIALVRIVPSSKGAAETSEWLQQQAAKLIANQKPGVKPRLNLQFVGKEKTAMEITFESQDPYRAQAEVSAVVLKLIEPNQSPTSLELLDGASLPQSPNFPNRIVISAIGLASGLVLGALTLMALRRRQSAALA